jgi:hypothetical protein
MIHSSNRELLSIVLGDEARCSPPARWPSFSGCARLRQTTTLGAAQEVLPYAVPTD